MLAVRPLLGDDVITTRLKSFKCCCLFVLVDKDEQGGGDENEDDVTDVIEQIDCGRPPNFNDLGSYLIGFTIDVICFFVGDMGCLLFDEVSLLICGIDEDEDDVEDDDKEDIVTLRLLGIICLKSSTVSLFG